MCQIRSRTLIYVEKDRSFKLRGEPDDRIDEPSRQGKGPSRSAQSTGFSTGVTASRINPRKGYWNVATTPHNYRERFRDCQSAARPRLEQFAVQAVLELGLTSTWFFEGWEYQPKATSKWFKLAIRQKRKRIEPIDCITADWNQCRVRKELERVQKVWEGQVWAIWDDSGCPPSQGRIQAAIPKGDLEAEICPRIRLLDQDAESWERTAQSV